MGGAWLASSRSGRFAKPCRMRWTTPPSSDGESACGVQAVSGKVNRQHANDDASAPGEGSINEQRSLVAGGGLSRTDLLLDALPCAVDRVRAEARERDSGRVLVLLHRGRSHPPDLRDLSAGPGLHHRP